jgi:hypothetical protein
MVEHLHHEPFIPWESHLIYEIFVYDDDKGLSKNHPYPFVEAVASVVFPEPFRGQIDVREFAFPDHNVSDALAIRGNRSRFCNSHSCRRGTFQLRSDRCAQGRTYKREIGCEYNCDKEKTEQYDEERIQSG